MPFDGIPHAGGEYFLRHVRALIESGHDVSIIAPATSDNEGAVAGAPRDVTVRLVSPEPRPLRDRAERLLSRAAPIWPPLGFSRAVRNDSVAVDLLRRADLVEFQWTQTIASLPRLRSLISPSATLVGYAHDVMTQVFERRLALRTGPRRLMSQMRVAQGRVVEPRLLGRLDAVLTFSEKDRTLLAGMHVRTRLAVIRPPLVDPDRQTEPSGRPNAVLFVAAFDRPENAEGAEWLLSRVWPRVVEAQPEARLSFVGAFPSERLLDAARRTPSVSVSGYVADLDPSYRDATVVVIPLLLGAGVKFKTITAMAWGLPVVSTSVGVEGVFESGEGEELGVAVADDPAEFAAALIEALRDPGSARARARVGQEAVRREFGSQAFATTLDTLYVELTASSGRADHEPRTG